MSYIIRKMTLDDLEQVVAIDQASFGLPWPARSFQFELTDNPASRCWVTEVDGRVIAMLVAWFIVDEVHVATLATHPEFRGQGAGRKLILHALSSAKEEGAVKSFWKCVRAILWLSTCTAVLVLWKMDAAQIIIKIMVKMRS